MARASTAVGFAPNDRPRVAVAPDGTLAAIQEPTRISVVEVPSCAVFAELGTDPGATENDITWVGTPPRLMVVSRYGGHSTAHLVDPFGPRSLAEIRLETPMRLVAAVGAHALVIGPQGAAIITATDKTLTPHSFPTRIAPVAAGAAAGQFMVALPGTIEEWDPQTRMPKRRLKLPRPVGITAVGGSDRVVWMTTQQEPARVDVIALVNRGQPKAHDLPEPIASVAAHPRSDLIACIGATSGRMWVIDLDGRTGLRVVGPEGIDRPDAAGIVFGRVAGVLAAQATRSVTVVTLDRPDPTSGEGEAPRTRRPSAPPAETTRSSLYGEQDEGHEQDESPTSVTLAASMPQPSAEPPVTAAPQRPVSKPELPQFGVPVRANRPPTMPPPAVAEWRERIESPRARTAEPIATLWPDAPVGWREDLVTWAKAMAAGQLAELPGGTPIERLVTRMELPPQLEPVVALAYAQHLLGQDGISPTDVVSVQRNSSGAWDEALGRGELVARGVATFTASRVRLTELVMRVLDDHPPRSGTIVGTPGMVSLLGPCVIVAAGPLAIIAEACLASIGGAILAGHVDAPPDELVAEARPYGAAPMWRVRLDRLAQVPVDRPLILVADDDATADQLGVPRLT